MHQFDDPGVNRVCLGEDFITVLPADFDINAKTTQDALDEEIRIREQLEKEGQRLLEEEKHRA